MRISKMTGTTLGTIIVSWLTGCGPLPVSPNDESALSSHGNDCNVEFCKQVDHYYAGTSGEDTITVDCVQGPWGATVSNRKNGEYIVSGTYQLGSRETATIRLNWGGSTSYTVQEEFTASRGSGSFSLRVIKSSGGDGNMFMSMSSGGSYLLHSVLVNRECPAKTSVFHKDTETNSLVDENAETSRSDDQWWPTYDENGNSLFIE